MKNINSKYFSKMPTGNIRRLAGITVAATALALPAGIYAQFNQTINVEGKYVPEVVDHDPIAMYPAPVRLSVDTGHLEYDRQGVTVPFRPQAVAMEATGWNLNHSFDTRRGYVGLGLGSWLNASAEAGYRFLDSSRGVAGVRLNHTSTYLWRPESPSGEKMDRLWRYDERIGFYYAGCPGVGDGILEASADGRFSFFNYYGFLIPETSDEEKAPRQGVTDVNVRVAWQSPAEDSFRWSVKGGYRYFRFNDAWYDFDSGSLTAGKHGVAENHISLGGNLSYSFGEKSSIGLEIAGDALLPSVDYEWKNFTYQGYKAKSYGNIRLTPAYMLKSNSFSARIGVNLDFTCNGRYGRFITQDDTDDIKPGINDRYATFHISPDVRLDYVAGPLALYLRAEGGIGLNTLAAGFDRDYYSLPMMTATAPSYTPLDAAFGLRIGPAGGFEAGVEAAWKIVKNLPLGGYFMPLLNGDVISGGEFRGLASVTDTGWFTDLSGYSVKLHLGYDAGRWFSLKADGSYQIQNATTGYFNGYDRPRWVAGVSAESNPWSRLFLNVGYDYRGVRRIYVPIQYGGLIELADVPLADLTLLNAGIAYGITGDFRIWVRGDNLLNRHDATLPGLPMQGLSITAGLSLRF